MKQIQIWPNHVAVPHLDLVLHRASSEPLSVTLRRLSRLGFDTSPLAVEVHRGVCTD